MRQEVFPQGCEIVTVALEAAGVEAARPFIERAAPEHPSLIDQAHLVDERFGIVNVPNSVWIDEAGTIVRPAEPAWPPAPAERGSAAREAGTDPLPERIQAIMSEAGRIVSDRDQYVAALRDWVRLGAESRFAHSPDEVVRRSAGRGRDEAMAAAEFELGQHLFRAGDLAAARPHFARAHALQPQNWTYRRQAWSLEPSGIEGPLARFWQGPIPGQEDAWPYAGDWVADTRAAGAENYYPRFVP